MSKKALVTVKKNKRSHRWSFSLKQSLSLSLCHSVMFGWRNRREKVVFFGNGFKWCQLLWGRICSTNYVILPALKIRQWDRLAEYPFLFQWLFLRLWVTNISMNQTPAGLLFAFGRAELARLGYIFEAQVDKCQMRWSVWLSSLCYTASSLA